jgi:hypothetical protein
MHLNTNKGRPSIHITIHCLRAALSFCSHISRNHPPRISANTNTRCTPIESSAAPPQWQAHAEPPTSLHAHRVAPSGRAAEMPRRRRYGSPCWTVSRVESACRKRACWCWVRPTIGDGGGRANAGTGGTPETQREFLESVSTENANSRRPPDRGRKPPIANQFALGYTYQDVLDTDHEGVSTGYAYSGDTNNVQTHSRASRSTSSRTPRRPSRP